MTVSTRVMPQRKYGSFNKTQTLTNNYALRCDGVNDAAFMYDADALSFGSPSGDSSFSVAVWAKLYGTTNACLFAKGSATNQGEYMMAVNASNKILFLLYSSGNTSREIYVSSTTSFASFLSGWHQFVGTYAGSGAATNLAIYVDGVQLGTTTAVVGTYSGMMNTGMPAMVGINLLNNTNYVNGLYDEVAVYNHKLTATQVVSMFNNSMPFDHSQNSGCVAWWRFGDRIGDTVTTGVVYDMISSLPCELANGASITTDHF